MFQPINFNGVELEKGDIVTIVAQSFPFEFSAAVVSYDSKKDALEVMSTQLVVTQHGGMFPSDDVESIQVVHKYDKGLPMEARAELKRGQRCEVIGINDQPIAIAIVTAAFDGMVTGETVGTPGVKDGTPVCGGSSYWKAA